MTMHSTSALPASGPWSYLLFEARRAPWRAALAATGGGALVVFATHALFARFPPTVLRFMEQAFAIEGFGSILLINDLLAAYFVTFFVGLGSLLDATVTAREEGRLELLLAKPIRASVLVAARVSPILVTSALTGSAVAVVIALAVEPHLAPGDPITVRGALGSSLFLVALGVTMLSVLVPVFVVLRDRLQALLVGALAWIGPLLPAGFFIYRPDLFDDGGGIGAFVLVPSLLWHYDVASWLGPVALAVSLSIGAVMVVLGGRILERTDAR